MIGAAIAAAELGFWVILVVGLVVRYVLRARHASRVLLLLLPVVDLALLAFVVVDLAQGARPSQSHALAACYLGFTVAFGHVTVAWADRKVAHLLAGTPMPPRPAKGTEHIHGLWVEWLRVLLGAGLSALVLLVLATVVRGDSIPRSVDAAAHDPLWAQVLLLGMVVVAWFLAGPAFATPAPARRRD